MTDTTKPDATTHIRIAPVTTAERGAINILTPEERKRALLAAARAKALAMFPAEGDEQ